MSGMEPQQLDDLVVLLGFPQDDLAVIYSNLDVLFPGMAPAHVVAVSARHAQLTADQALQRALSTTVNELQGEEGGIFDGRWAALRAENH